MNTTDRVKYITKSGNLLHAATGGRGAVRGFLQGEKLSEHRNCHIFWLPPEALSPDIFLVNFSRMNEKVFFEKNTTQVLSIFISD